MKKVRNALFLLCLAVFVVTSFTKNSYRSVENIHPAVLEAPIQRELLDRNKITFVRDEYEYILTPLYDYELNGLVIKAMDYTWFSLLKRDSVFPKDICVIWGENAGSSVYQKKNLRFRQDFRFCLYEWYGDVKFNASELSNNHLVATNDQMEKLVKSISEGDQVRIKGKLVNIEAVNVGIPGKYDPERFIWNSSTTRADSGGGACETILVESVEILAKGNSISHLLNKISLYGMGILALAAVINFFKYIFANKTSTKTKF